MLSRVKPRLLIGIEKLLNFESVDFLQVRRNSVLLLLRCRKFEENQVLRQRHLERCDGGLVWLSPDREAAVLFFSTRGVINGPSSNDSVHDWLLAVASLSSLC